MLQPRLISVRPKLFFLLVIMFCSFYFAIRLWSVEEGSTIPQLLKKFTDLDVIHKLSNRVAVNGSFKAFFNSSSLSRKIAETMEVEDVPMPDLPEISPKELYEEEKNYYHDDQYLLYKKCPTSVRLRIANNSLIKHKFIEDMPILIWDKHLNPTEYKRMSRFLNINGFHNMHYKNLSSTIHKLTSENNRYMFDDLLHAEEKKECIRCAIIGNGGILNGSKMGAEIDSHDYVFRVNTALTKGFEKDVGGKTSFYCFTMVTLSNTLGGSRKFGFTAPPSPPGIRYLVFADNEWTYMYFGAHFAGNTLPRSADKYHRSPPKFNIPVTPDIVKLVHPDFLRYLKWSWVNSTNQHKTIHRPTTGAIMLLVALHTCDEVNAYGFGGSYTKYSDHYYERKFSKHTFYANHDDRTEQKMWHMLDEQKIISLYKRDEDKR
ncbi:alpha-N-acetylgalactosaminide alpha-2,6-sialyltransferase 2-like isoform X2 [Apostichopus japonicus]|uniref:alpha-N-acetylgalactosaminide alpha-2,6-sialyltransferase 2-like isoform X2 n=1 Tax=Stichopus japonicus TaxID=307972 RepID=UPI003AB8608D